MSRISKVELEYWDALERLKNGKTRIVDTRSSRFKFTKDAVGREAGRGKGYVRYERYPLLCDAIADAEAVRKEGCIGVPSYSVEINRQKSLKNKEKEKYKSLKREYDILMTEYLNVIRRNFELETGLTTSANVKLMHAGTKK